jgi:mannose/fructose/N-acetylgalactosamine-specific phosphotransferase system component IID
MLVSSFIIALVSEIAKKFTTMGAVIASLPLTSMLVVFWLYRDTKDPILVIDFLDSMVWIILPSITFFIVFSLLLKKQFNFYLSMTLAIVAMLISYVIFLQLMKWFNIHI